MYARVAGSNEVKVFMRYFRHLPPLLRMASVVGLLLILASLALSTALLFHVQPFLPQAAVDTSRMQLVSMNLGLLGLVVVIVILNHNIRFRQLATAQFPLSNWQSQLLAIAVLWVLPLCALAVALFFPPSLRIYSIAFGISVFGAWMTLGAFFWLLLWRPSVAG